MRRSSVSTNSALVLLAAFLMLVPAIVSYAKPSASMKFITVREENPKMAKETMILPYAFFSESMGTTFGGVLGLWDYKIPTTDRL